MTGLVIGQAPGRKGVSSVALTVPNILAVTGSPITDSGTFAISLVSQNANLVLAGPTSGGPDTPTYRALVAADLPAAALNVGTVTSVGLSVPSILSVSGSPITGAGTLAVTLASQNANLVLAGPTSGGAAAPTFRALVVADIPTLDDTRLANAVILAPAASTRNVIQPTGATIKALIVKGAASQSANLQEWQNSGGTALLSVSPDGTMSHVLAISGTGAKIGYSGAGTVASSDNHVYGMWMGHTLTPGDTKIGISLYGGAIISVTSPASVQAYGVYAATLSKTGTGTVSLAASVYIADQSIATDNYGLYSAAAKNYFIGNVGIGVAAPAAKLHILGAASGIGLIVRNSPTTPSNLQEWHNSGGSAVATMTNVGALFVPTLTISTGASAGVVINSRSGAGVPVQLYNPTGADLRFYANNDIAILTAGGLLTLGSTAGDGATNQTTNMLTLNHYSAGVIAAGFGTGLKFQGQSSTTASRDMARVRAEWTTATDASRAAKMVFSAYNIAVETDLLTLNGSNASAFAVIANSLNNNIFSVQRNGADVFTVTNSPSYANIIDASGAYDGGLRFYNSTTLKWSILNAGSDSFKLKIIASASATPAVTIDQSGNVSIGGSPVAGNSLTLSSASANQTSLRMENTSTGGKTYELGNTGPSASIGVGKFYLYDRDNFAFRLIVDSSGNVGIGTSPSYLLDVSHPTAGGALFRAVRASTTRGVTINADGQAIFGSSLSTDDGIFQFNLETALARATSTAVKAVAFKITAGIAPTGGSDQNIAFGLYGTVNQTGGTGITRGMYINQTITAAVDYRAFEVAAGKSVFGGNVGVGVAAPSSAVDVAGDIEVGFTNAHYFGDPTTDGSLRLIPSGTNLLVQRRIAGAWTTQSTL